MEIFRQSLRDELVSDILAFWINRMPDNENGGFYGRIDGNDMLHKEANKGAILNARILWTFSAAYRIFKNPDYLEMAVRAKKYIQDHFWDNEYGGIFWELNYEGNPVNEKKQIYAQGFALYGFSEFYRATNDVESLELAKKLFFLIEQYSHDNEYGGYLEAFTREWQPIEDMRLSDKDANEKKTMNTHLHILEPYTNLLRVWKGQELIEVQHRLIDIFSEKILNPKTGHLNLFFDEQWNCKSETVSYGHDIEASWLLFEAAKELGDDKLLHKIRQISLKIANAALEGFQPDGSMIYESEGKNIDTDRHWWVQAETVAGLYYAYINSGKDEYLNKSLQCWQYIQQNLMDRKYGEWFWSVDEDGIPNTLDDKAGFWKCPYHNARMCMEIIDS